MEIIRAEHLNNGHIDELSEKVNIILNETAKPDNAPPPQKK